MSWTQNLCRTCGQISETCHNIYSTDVNRNLETKIKACLQLQIKLEDLKPKQICNNCLLKLNDLAEFLHIAQATDLKFDTIYYSTYKKIGHELETTDIPSKAILVSNKETNPHVGPFDSDMPMEVKGISEFWIASYEVLVHKYLLKLSNETFKKTCLKSELDEKFDFWLDANNIYNSPSGDFFPTSGNEDICNYGSAHEMCLLDDSIKERSRRVQRLYDYHKGRVMSNPDNNKKYMISVETVRNSFKLSSMNVPDSFHNGVFVCTKCNREFTTEDSLKTHIIYKHQPGYGAPQSGVIAYKMEAKKRRRKPVKKMNVHKRSFKHKRGNEKKAKFGVRNIQCTLCTKLFKSRRALKKHEKAHIEKILKSNFYKKVQQDSPSDSKIGEINNA